jgi:glyoxylase-like metal-dependent hydrolase (beta-lactamase superfamily II)
MVLGSFELFPLSDGFFALDGGAMFGVVPRVFWQKTNPPDDRNRITLALRPLLVKTPAALVLIETGIGDKQGGKFRDIYRVEHSAQLLDTLAQAGFRPEQVTHVIHTHLHFDHAGGATRVSSTDCTDSTDSKSKTRRVASTDCAGSTDSWSQTQRTQRSQRVEPGVEGGRAEARPGPEESGARRQGSAPSSADRVVPTFPNAEYWVQEKEWQMALEPDVRSRASYLPENYAAIEQAGLLRLAQGDAEVTPGVRVILTGGHTAGHQVVVIDATSAEGRVREGTVPVVDATSAEGKMQDARCKVQSAESSGKAIYWGDLIPTCSHVNVPYVMGYDTMPLQTMEWKEKLLARVLAEDWLMFFEHDPEKACARLRKSGDRYECVAVEDGR